MSRGAVQSSLASSLWWLVIAIKFLADISMIQSWKWFLEFQDRLLNCFCLSGFYYEISYCPFFKLSENWDLNFITKKLRGTSKRCCPIRKQGQSQDPEPGQKPPKTWRLSTLLTAHQRITHQGFGRSILPVHCFISLCAQCGPNYSSSLVSFSLPILHLLPGVPHSSLVCLY